MHVKEGFAELRDKVAALLNRAAENMQDVVPLLGDEGGSGLVQSLQERANAVQNEEFVVVVVGEMKRGKSMLLNAMMRRQLLAMDVLECTATVNFLRYPRAEESQSPDHVEVHFIDEKKEKVPVDELSDYTSRHSGRLEDVASEVDHVDVFVESRFLEDNVLLVDTPGTNTTTETHTRITNDQIDRSSAAIFLFGAQTQVTQSDRQFLESVEEAVGRLFFVVNRIDTVDESEVGRVLQRVEDGIRNVVDRQPADKLPVFGVSAAKAFLGRVGYAKNSILAEKERDKLADPLFCHTLIEESGIQAFENALEEYLFRGGKGYDLLHTPLSFVQSEAAKCVGKLDRQKGVLDDTFDLSGLELEIEKTARIVDERKHELEGRAEELAEELSRALLQARDDWEERRKSQLEEIRDEINAYDSYDALKENWDEGARLANLPGRKLAGLDRKADQLFKYAVGRVLRKQAREIRSQLRSELDEVDFDLPEVTEIALSLQKPKFDEGSQEKIRDLEEEIEKGDLELGKMEEKRALAESAEHRYVELQDNVKQLKEERIGDRQMLGSRPEVRVYTETGRRERKRKGLFGAIGNFFLGPKIESYGETVTDDKALQWHEEEVKRIEKWYKDKRAELDLRVKEARAKRDPGALNKARTQRMETLNQTRRQALEKEEARYRESKAKSQQRVVEASQAQLLGAFRSGAETLAAGMENIVSQTQEITNDFIGQTVADIDATLQGRNQELAKLKSLKEQKESEKDARAEEIDKALEGLTSLQEEAAQLQKEHEAFAEKGGEEATR